MKKKSFILYFDAVWFLFERECFYHVGCWATSVHQKLSGFCKHKHCVHLVNANLPNVLAFH